MERTYSASSAKLDNLDACFGALKQLIKPKTADIKVGLLGQETWDPSKAASLGPLSSVVMSFGTSDKPISCTFNRFWPGILSVKLEGTEGAQGERILQLVEDTLRLTEPTFEDRRSLGSLPAIADIAWRIYDRVEAIERVIQVEDRAKRQRPRCFVSFRFDDHSRALAFELREFLELCDCEFVSGLGYEPRSVSEKVLERLSQPLDLFIVLQTVSGDSAWINQEVGAARARRLPVLVLKEEGAAAPAGLLGDTEYLAFAKDHVSMTFVGILQALRSLRETHRGT